MKCPRCGRPATPVMGCDFGANGELASVHFAFCTCVPEGTLVVVPNGWRARLGRRLADALAELSKAVGQ
jgi:hypothetical protein